VRSNAQRRALHGTSGDYRAALIQPSGEREMVGVLALVLHLANAIRGAHCEHHQRQVIFPSTVELIN